MDDWIIKITATATTAYRRRKEENINRKARIEGVVEVFSTHSHVDSRSLRREQLLCLSTLSRFGLASTATCVKC